MTPPRHLSLDVLRGVAVLGILLMNISAFALPAPAYINPRAWGGSSAPDLALWLASFVLIDGKMRALFTLLFGASTLLMVTRADATGHDGAALQRRRLGWLFGFGALHYLLLWSGDILMLYALCGFVALFFIELRASTLLVIAFALLSAGFALWYADLAIISAQVAAGGRTAAAMLSDLGEPGAPALAAEVALMRSGYAAILADRIAHGSAILIQFITNAPESLGLMALGMAGLRSGFLTGDWPPRAYARLAAAGLAIGLVGMGALAVHVAASGFATLTTARAMIVWAYPLRLPLTIGLAALALLLIQRWPNSAAITRLAAAGRMAFSNYLLTSLLMTSVFYGYGLGWFGLLSRAQAYALVPLVWALMLIWSPLWLAHFTHGPFEWLWRCLTHARIEPLRRSIIA